MKIKNLLLCGAGFLFLGLGMIGLMLPILPTTPFVLVAAGCFASTPKIYKKVIKIPFFREYIQSYREKKGLRPQTVTISLLFLWGMLILSALSLRTVWIVLVLGLVGIAVTIHILWIARTRNC